MNLNQREKKKVLNNMPTTEKVISQVQCQACGKSMSAKNLKYSHAAYCIKRVQEVDKPKAIPVPKKIMKNLMKLKTVKDVQPDEELYDSEGEIFKGSIIPSDNITINNIKSDNITKLKHQLMKAEEEYIINKKADLSMYKANNVLRPEDIEPTYEVRMKTARQKKQEKYDKLTLKAF